MCDSSRKRYSLSIFAFAIAFGAAAGPARAQQTGVSDDEQAGGEALRLEEILDYAEAHAPQIQQARRRVGLGDAAIAGAEKFQQFNPEIEGEFGVGLGDFGLNKVEVTLTQRLEIAGERGLRMDAAEQRKKALVAELAQARWDVHQQVHRLYRQGLVDQKRVEIEREVVDFTRRLFEVAQQRFEAGEEPKMSMIVAQAEVATARQLQMQADAGYMRTLRDLGAAVGWAKDVPPQPTGEPQAARPVPPAEKLLEMAHENDPRLLVLNAQLAQARAELAFEERSVWPDLLLGVGYEREDMGGPNVEDKLRLIVGVPLPLWDRNQGEIAAATTRTAIFQQAIDDRKTVLKSLVLKQAESVEAAYQQAQIYQEEVLPALENQLDLLQQGFKLGELSLLDVMNARDRLLAVQRQYLGALNEYYAAVSELEERLGTPIWQAENNR